MDNFEIHSLGHRAFFLFLMTRIKGTLFLLFLALAMWYGGVTWSAIFLLVGCCHGLLQERRRHAHGRQPEAVPLKEVRDIAA